jgi:hypothetical protein
MDLVDSFSVLDLNSSTGFAGIEACYSKASVEGVIPKTKSDLDKTCKELLATLEEGLELAWDSNIPHFVMCSAGKDSRILAHLLKRLETKNGRDWLGTVLLVCHEEGKNDTNIQDSSLIFTKVMNDIGFRTDEFRVFNEKGIGKPDYFVFDPTFVPNGFHKYGNHFFEIDPKEWCCVTGAFGGELLDYPKTICSDDRLKDLMTYVSRYGYNLEQYSYNFKELLMPYLHEPFVETAFAIQSGMFQHDIRKRMLQMLGDKTPHYYIGHNYNFELSPSRKKEIRNLYQNSKFFDRYSDIPAVKTADPGLYSHGLADKLFGLSLTYG